MEGERRKKDRGLENEMSNDKDREKENVSGRKK